MNKIEILITFDPATGSVEVKGPMQDKMLCFGLLEMAKQSVVDFKPNQVQTAPAGLQLKAP